MSYKAYLIIILAGSSLLVCRQADTPYRHTSERIQGTISTPVRAYLAIKRPKLLAFEYMRTMYTDTNLAVIIVF